MLANADLRLIVTLMAPEYIIPLAKQHGSGCAVTGAHDAILEVRSAIRSYLRYTRWRDGDGAFTRPALALRALGYQGTLQPLSPMQSPWRQTAPAFWPHGGFITNDLEVEVGAHSQREVDAAALIAVGRALRAVSEANRAFLQGRVWQRESPEVLFNFELAGEMRSVVLDPADKEPAWITDRLKRVVLKARELDKHPYAHIGAQLIREWARAGMITSMGGCMVATVGSVGVEKGYGALAPFNGIPIVELICNVQNGKVWLTAVADHRAIDGRGIARWHKRVRGELMSILRAT